MSDTKNKKKVTKLEADEIESLKKNALIKAKYISAVSNVEWYWYFIFIIPLIAIIVAFIYWRDILFKYEWEKPTTTSPGFWYYLDDNNEKVEVDLTGDIEKKWNIWMIVINSIMLVSSIALIVLFFIAERKAVHVISILFVVMLILWFIVLIWWEGRMVQIINTMNPETAATSTFTNKISEAFSNITKKLRKY